jgi:hypothetical protein
MFFFQTIISHHCNELSDSELVCVDGKDNLFNEANQNIMQVNTEEGGKNIVIFDADTANNLGGFTRRNTYMESKRQKLGLDFKLFLLPNNHDDGDLEVLLERIAQKEKHKTFFDCFNDYELCITGKKDDDGNPVYCTPNLKGKLFTYISSMKLNNSSRRKLGRGNWMFENNEYWDIESDELKPLINFLKNA